MKSDSSIPDIKSILLRLLAEPSFALNDLRHNSIVSGVIGYTSAVEYYLQDIIELCLKRNSSLRKKGLSTIQISAMELEQDEETKTIKNKLLKSLASDNSKGKLLSNKLKKASTFLSLKNISGDANLLKSLDSIWQLRNRFAHENQSSIFIYEISTEKGGITLPRDAKSEHYNAFIFELVKIIDACNSNLFAFDEKALNTWKSD